MRDLIILLVHLITTVFRIVRPGDLRSVVAESVLMKHQLLIVNRPRRRAPNLRYSGIGITIGLLTVTLGMLMYLGVLAGEVSSK